MLKNHVDACRSLVAALALLACLHPALPTYANEPQYATVALLLPPGGLADPICVVFDGADMSAADTLAIEGNSAFAGFSGADLYSTDAKYLARGGQGREVAVRGVDAVAPDHGVILLGPQSDAEVLLQAPVYLEGATVRYESVPEYATYVLVIVRGRVR
jgi:hypothetical protein